jgi:tRNA pseudouridine13 synthase
MAASERVRALGLQVAVGDLVFLSPDVELEEATEDDAAGMTLTSAEEQVASIACVTGEDINDSVHIVTEEDVAAKRFVSTDVVLPLLGFNSLLPSNEVGPYIQNMIDENDITLELFRKHPFFQFSGSYRRVFSRPGHFEWSTLTYSERNTDLLATELKDFQVKPKPDRKNSTQTPSEEDKEDKEVEEVKEEDVKEEDVKEEEEEDAPKQYLAAVLKFSLPAGAYATMLLREVMKTSTESGYHSGLTSCSMQASAQAIRETTEAAATAATTVTVDV